MEYFVQQLINGVTLGSIYGLIAIGYTMVYGIIGMINFAHGDIYMVGAFLALLAFLALDCDRCNSDPDRAVPGAADRDGADRAVRLDGRALRLPAAARLVPPRAADLGDRHVDHAAELRADRARRARASRCRR